MKLLALSFLAFALAAPASLAQDDAPASEAAASDIIATLEASGNFTALVGALRDTGLDEALSGAESYTLFAPTDEAFADLPEGTLEALDTDALVALLRAHLVVGSVLSSEAAGLGAAPSVQGDTLRFSATGDALTVNGVVVTDADIAASNGVIHALDDVLMPAAETESEGEAEPEMKYDEEGDASTGTPPHKHVSDSPPETDDDR